LVAATLAGTWRDDPPLLTLAESELAGVAPLLLDSGCGALAWRRVRSSPLAGSVVAEELRDAYRLHSVQAVVRDRDVGEVVRRLRSEGVDAVIVKGWSAARLYPEPGLRPYGDIDVCVAPAHYETARAALDGADLRTEVDLHPGLALNGRVVRDLPTFEDAHARAGRAPLSDVDVPVLAAEDELALLSVHLLSHGAWRPLWLCDVAAAVERLPAQFDWERCLGRSRRLATWVAATLTLAERLLGARINCPPQARPRTPRWLEPAVLKQWGSARPDYPPDLIGLPPSAYLRPAQTLRVLRAHWVNPISATMLPGAPINSLPRLPYQLRFVVWKASRFVRQLRKGASAA